MNHPRSGDVGSSNLALAFLPPLHLPTIMFDQNWSNFDMSTLLKFWGIFAESDIHNDDQEGCDPGAFAGACGRGRGGSSATGIAQEDQDHVLAI